MALAPEHPLVLELTKESHKDAVWNYLEQVKKKSERERIGALKEVSGCFIGEYVLHPLTQKPIPIWISDYVLVNYGTGAIMGVPAHDERDERFARHFSLPIENLPFLREEELERLVKQQQAEKTTQYKIRDAIFSRQRYWGEPIPIYYKEGIPTPLPETSLPLLLPNVSDFRPTEEGSSPLGRLDSWKTPEGYPLETSTMPGFAGSCAYSLRYMSPKNSSALVSKEANIYWQQVDLYVGGSEHATGHLLYSRFWNHFLYDIGAICQAEPFKKLLNQGMIQGRSQFCYRLKSNSSHFVSFNKIEDFSTVIPIHVSIEFVQNDLLNLEKFKAFRSEYKEATFTLDEKGHYVCGYAVEKMSKSLLNVCNPDTIIALYGADVFRLYEMFLGPITQSKPWNTDSIEGVDRFLKKFQRLFYTPLQKTTPTQKELQILHKVISKVTQDIENFSFNTAVSALMIAVNDLTQEKCCNSDILKELTLILAPFTPFICEEIWEQVFQEDSSIFTQKFPEANPEYLKESTFSCPVSINGKLKFLLEMPKGLSAKEMEEFLLNDGQIQQYLKGPTKKIIAVPDRIINIVA